ncbi:hypothetical protein C1752_00001 [Acaryochloris thomasi RCC1774]|uniref:Uncharacterized protein n=1 Tax=Acaryochloris thomasi RCC1774 TaxID=1764569 RepID=A0A2W1JQ74_9CYAN|nr:hypothetical protein C1752_00001 [Acaryochloris thomasi RCC1774]
MYQFGMAEGRSETIAKIKIAGMQVTTGGDPRHVPARAHEKAGFTMQTPSVWLSEALGSVVTGVCTRCNTNQTLEVPTQMTLIVETHCRCGFRNRQAPNQ